MQRFTRQCICPQINLLLLRSSAKQKWPKMTFQLFMLKLKFTKSFYTPTLLEFMNFMKMKKEFTFSWNIAKMESYLTTLTQEAHFQTKKLQKYSNKFCQLWNIWNHKEFFTEISSVKTFFLIKIGMQSLWISDLLQNKLMKNLAELFVDHHPIQLQNSLQNPNIRHNQWMYGV